MKVLILGGSGMLGHKLLQVHGRRSDVWAAARARGGLLRRLGLVGSDRLVEGVEAGDLDSVARALAVARPDVVVNAVGIVKQKPEAADAPASLTVNAMFPHRLARLCALAGARLVHISTDCVFSGRKGNYTEDDTPDAADLYGRSKLLGELSGPGRLTIRTSIIGRELAGSAGLLEWFLGQRGKTVRGYAKAVFSGLTTLALAETLETVIEDHPDLSGLYHVASDPITKLDLLVALRDAYRADVRIEPASDVVIDRSLDGRRFRAATGLAVPSWPDMIRALLADPTPYDEWRQPHGA